MIDGCDFAVGGGFGGFSFVEIAQAFGELFATAFVVRAFEADDHGEGFGWIGLFHPRRWRGRW